MADYCNEKDPTNKKILVFLRKYSSTTEKTAKDLGVKIESILGLAATESGYGTSKIAKEANNFFGLHAGAPKSSGSYTTSQGIKVAKFPDYATSLESFKIKFGNLVKGKAKPEDFVSGLIPKFNPANTKQGGNPNFKKDTLAGIKAIVRRMSCDKPSAHKCGAPCQDFAQYGNCDRMTTSTRCWQHS